MIKPSIYLPMLLVIWIANARAENPAEETPLPPERDVGNGAVFDVERYKMEHALYRAAIDDIRSDEHVTSAKLAKARDKIAALIAARDKVMPLSNAAEQLSRKIIRLEEEAALIKILERRETNRRKAKAISNLYAELQKELDVFANCYGIDIVFTYKKEPLDLRQPMSVEEAKQLFDADIVYHNHVDVTDNVLPKR